MMSFVGRLDVEYEKFEEISLPQFDYSYSNVTIGVLNGKFHVILSLDEGFKFEVWTLMGRSNYNDNEDYLWIKEFFVDGLPNDWVLRCRGKELQLIKTCEDGEILCLVNAFCLFKFNPKTKRMQKLKQNEGNQKSFWVQIDSLNFNSLGNILGRDDC